VPRRGRSHQTESDRELRFLILEDAVADAKLCERELQRAGLRFTMRQVETLAEFEAELDRFVPDLIFADFTFPGGFDGLAALDIARRKLPDVPFMFVSGTIGEERAVDAVRRGAADYVLKDRLDQLGPAVIRVLESTRLKQAWKRDAPGANDSLYRSIFEGAAEGTMLTTPDGYLLAANPAVAQMLGYGSPEELVSTITNPGQRIYAEPRARRAILEQVQRDGKVHGYETRGQRKDGSSLWVSVSARLVNDERGGRAYVVVTMSDISERKRAEASLAESEERFRAAFEQAGVGMALRGIEPRESRWLRVNQKLCDILGYTQEELLQLTSVDITPPEDRDLAIDYNEKLLKGEITSYSREKRYQRKDGRIIWASITLTAVSGPDGRRSHVISVIQDVTDRREAEEKVKRLSRVRAVLGGINAAIVRIDSQQALFDEACHIAVEQGKFEVAWIATCDPATQEITPVAWAGDNAERLAKARSSARHDVPLGFGVTGKAIETRMPVFVNDLGAEMDIGSERRRDAILLGYRSAIGLPLIVDGTAIAVLTLFTRDTNFFNEEELQLMTELAGNISFALEHVARQKKIEKLSRVRAMTSEINAAIVRVREHQALLEETCRIASVHGGFEMVWIGTIDHERQQVRPATWTGFSPEAARAVSWATISAAKGTLGEAMHTRRAAVRDDIETQLLAGKLRQEALEHGCHSTVCMPLVVDDQVTALIALFTAGRGFFDDEELALLNELAGNISFALEHLTRQQKLEKLSRVRAVSSELNAAIVRVRGREALLREACRIATEHGKFELVWVALIDQEKQQIKPVAWTGFSPETAQAVNWASTSAPGVTLSEVMRTRRLAVRNDIEAEQPTGLLRQEAVKKGFRSTVCLPFVVDEKVVAAMILFAAGRNFFIDDELALLNEVAGDISFALEHIARQEKIERLSRIRSVLGEINAAIVRIRGKQELFDEACRIAVEAGGLTFAWIGVVERDPMQIRPAAWAGVEDPLLSDRQSPRPIDDRETGGPGPFAGAVVQKKVVVVNDVQNDPRISRKQDHLERGINSIAVLPLLVAGEAVGVLGLHAREAGFFDEEEVKLLSELAGDIAFALQTIDKQDQIDYLSYYDALTGLPNRTLFIDRAGQQMRSRGGEPMMTALVLLNLDRFRNINETLGRHGGDELLKLVARRLENAFNGKDYLARTGADVFGIVIRGMRDTAAVVHTIENQVLGCIREPFDVAGSELRVAAKAGIALHPADGNDADTLYSNAEAALKRVRDSGEQYLFYAAEMNARVAQRVSLETRLRKAVEARQFVLHYQPKFDLSNDSICGLEALIRWQDPESGLVAPGMFIPLLEETGLILEVGKWALAQALAQHREWAAHGCTVPRIAVNVSAVQLQKKDFSEIVIGAVQEGGGMPEALEIEITESLLMKDIEASIRKLSILRGLGIHIAMDDFGTGYSSLSYIARLPINSVKIDRSFINGMAASPQDMAIVTTIIALAHSLNLRVVAEGVETESQSKLLKLLKCDEAQGYLFSKPLPAAEIEPLLLTQAQSARDRPAKPESGAQPAPTTKSRAVPSQPGARRTKR